MRQTSGSSALCPAPAAGSADITSLYTARYGVPPVGMKVFVRVNQFVDGWEDTAAKFSAIVPAVGLTFRRGCWPLTNCPPPASRRAGVLANACPLLVSMKAL